MTGVLFVISGPSGVGKGTLVKLLLKENKSFALSVSCTTRTPRSGEREGEHYFFLTREEFLKRREEGGFLEWDEHFGNLYGTPKAFVLDKLKAQSVILEIDVMGALKVKEALKGTETTPVLIMIAPPSVEALEKRLEGRASETERERSERLERVKFELEKGNEYDYVVVNDVLDEAKSTLEEIIKKEIEKRRKSS